MTAQTHDDDLLLQAGEPLTVEVSWRSPTYHAFGGVTDFSTAGGEIKVMIDAQQCTEEAGDSLAQIQLNEWYQLDAIPKSLLTMVEMVLDKLRSLTMLGQAELAQIDRHHVDPIMDSNWYEACNIRGIHGGVHFQTIFVGGERKAVSLALSEQWPSPTAQSLVVFADLDELPATIHAAAAQTAALVARYLARYQSGERGELGWLTLA